VELLERHDNFASLRNGLHRAAEHLGLWSGIPMPLEDETLVVEPTYPKAAELMAMCGGAQRPAETADREDIKVRNSFWSTRRRCEIVVIEPPSGKVTFAMFPGANHLSYDLRTLGCAEAWGVEQESNALALLGTLMTHRAFKQYLLTGTFVEKSRRSGITYMFRRLKPTVALHEVKGQMRILCALCMHPVAHYAGSWAGAMVPSDEIAAHLQMMRADERLYWARANQHPSWRPEAGV